MSVSLLEKWFPSIALKREKTRFEIARMRQAQDVLARYEGASQAPRMDGWTTVSDDSANSEVASGLVTLRKRSRDLARNTWIGKRAINVITQNVVGTGIRPAVLNDESAELLIDRWVRSTRCDAREQNNFFGLQALAFKTMLESGEALIIRQREPFTGNRIPISLKVIEGDYLPLDLNKDLKGGRKIIQGIEFDRRGKRLAYHLYREFPGDSFNTDLVRISADDVIHLFQEERPGQVRGVPIFAPVLIKIRDWDSFEDAQLKRQQLAACFTAFVHNSSGDPFQTFVESGGARQNPLATHFEPGTIQLLDPGEEITFGNPPDTSGYIDYSHVTLHEIAAGLGMSYEALTGDLSRVNFSSARLGWLEFQRRINADQSLLLEPLLLRKVTGWLVEALDLLGVELKNDVVWTPPKRELMDPPREIPAMQQAVRMGYKSLSETIRESGRDPKEVFKQYKEDWIALDESDLIFDSDPRNKNEQAAFV